MTATGSPARKAAALPSRRTPSFSRARRTPASVLVRHGVGLAAHRIGQAAYAPVHAGRDPVVLRIDVDGKLAFLQQRKGQPFDLGISLGLALPLGAATSLSSESGVGLSPRASAGYAFGSWARVGAELGLPDDLLRNIAIALRVAESR